MIKVRQMLLILFLLGPGLASRAITATDLRCEYQVQPLAIDTLSPRLTWILHSTKRGERSPYIHILVASSPALLAQNKGDLCDATVPYSSFPAGYAGKPLHSGQVCYWKVRAMFTGGAAGPWSAASLWEMGLLSPANWKAKWINDGKRNPTSDADFYRDDPAPLFRRSFEAGGRVTSGPTCDLGPWILQRQHNMASVLATNCLAPHGLDTPTAFITRFST